MFTGIVTGHYPVSRVERLPGLMRYAVELPKALLKGLAAGASVSVAGVCQTVVSIERGEVLFDAMEETLAITTLADLKEGHLVNIERALKMGQEIGGQLLSGHIFGVASIVHVDVGENRHVLTLRCPVDWMKYILPKGYIALDGVSLTIVDTKPEGTFRAALIPETLRLTTFANKKVGDRVNVEIDSQTQAIVDTVQAMLKD